MSAPARVVVAGAGIAGVSMARALARLGARVTMLAPPARGGASGTRGLDAGATARGAGILSTQFWDEALAPYALRSLRIVEGLARAGRLRLRRPGMAQIALSAREARKLEDLRRVRLSLGLPVREGLPRALRDSLAPAFLRRIVSATFAAEDSWLEAGELLSALAHDAGPRLRVETGRLGRGRREGLAVLALGASLRLPGTDRSRSVAASVRTPRRMPAMVHVLDTGFYGRPDGPGRAVVGDGEPPMRGARGVAGILGRPARSIRVWSGTCVMTADGRPLCGPTPDPRTWVLGGLGGDGLALAPALAEDLAAAMLGRRGAPGLSAFSLDRFRSRG